MSASDFDRRVCALCGASLGHHARDGFCSRCVARVSLLDPDEGEEELEAEEQRLEAGSQRAGGGHEGPDLQEHGPRPAHGARFGDYELLEEIGRGGMGVIYRARQESLDRLVAVKTILTGPLASPDFTQRFQTEAHAAAVLEHPNIVPIYEVGNHKGQPFYSMRLIPGRNLAQELSATGALPPRRAAELVATVAHAVHYAHQRGVLHRDLKPANILLDAEGNPHVTDFGLAKLLEHDDGLTLTQAALGTPNYMAPEQAAGNASQLTTAADVYSLGAILFELLTGRKLFTADTPLATINQAREQEPPKPSSVLRTVPRDLDTICWKCLEKEPHRRYASALALAEDLEHWLKGEPIRARRVGAVERLGLWCRRKPALASVAGAALVVVFIVSGIASWRLIAARHQKELEQYAANISLADTYIRDGATDRALDLLLQCPERLRHWEWGRLLYLCHQEIASIPAHTNDTRPLDVPLIQGVAVNRSGTRLATKGQDGLLKLWNPTNPVPLMTRGNFTNEVSAWDFAPYGRQLALGMADGGVEIIDAETGAQLRLLNSERSANAVATQPASRRIVAVELDPREEGPIYATGPQRPEAVLSLSYSPDGRRLAMNTGKYQIVIREALTAAELARLDCHLSELEKAWFTPDGSSLVVKGRLALELIDTGSGQCKATNVWSGQKTAKLFVDPTGRFALTFDHSGMAHLWKDGKRTSSLGQRPHPQTSLTAAFFDSKGRWVCTTGKATKAALFEVASGQLVFSLNQDVNGGAFSEDGQRLLTFGPDRLIRLWDVAQARELRILRGHLSVPELGTFSGDGRLIATASREGVVKLWTGLPGRELVQTRGLAMIGPYTADGRYWATSPNWNGTFVCEADTGRVAAEFPLQKAGVLSMAFSPDGKFLITVGSERVARIWDVHERKLAGLLRGHDHVIWSVAWSADGRWIATGDSGGVARIWNAGTWRETRMIQAQSRSLYCVQIDTAGRKLLTAGYGLPKVWDIHTGRLLFELDNEQKGSYCGAFSPDGRKIACPCNDRQIRLWDAANGKLLQRWPTRSQSFAICAFSPDSRRLVLSVVDYGLLGVAAPFVEVWDTHHGRHLLDLRGHTDSIYGAVFNRQGNRVLTAAMDETVRQWETFPWKDADYREFPGATLAERIGSYADRYWKKRVSVEVASNTRLPSSPLGSENHPTPREWEAILRPIRAPDTSPDLLNLDHLYTGALEGVFRPEGGGYEGDDDLSRLPKGVVTLHGIAFDIRGVVLLRIGEQSPNFWWGWLDHPVRLDGISVGKKFRQLHVLHATVGQAAPSTPVGSYVLHYSDGAEQEFDILYGRDLRDWWLGGRGDPEKEVSHARVAWIGSNPFAEKCAAQVRLFLRTYENPRSDAEVVSVNFISKETTAAPFLVAMTVEP